MSASMADIWMSKPTFKWFYRPDFSHPARTLEIREESCQSCRIAQCFVHFETLRSDADKDGGIDEGFLVSLYSQVPGDTGSLMHTEQFTIILSNHGEAFKL